MRAPVLIESAGLVANRGGYNKTYVSYFSAKTIIIEKPKQNFSQYFTFMHSLS